MKSEALRTKSVSELLELHVSISEELRHRGVLRTANNPTGDYAEYLFCRAFGWNQEANSKKAVDAFDSNGVRYQIKGRRLHRRNKSRQLSAIRDLDGFDILAAVLFDDTYSVWKAALIPVAIVRARVTQVKRTNSYKFILQDEIWRAPEVIDVTDRLQGAQGR